MLSPRGQASGSAARAFSRLTAALRSRLPGPLGRIPETWIAFAIIGLTAFGIDIGVLTLIHGVLGAPYPIAVTVGYTVASIVNFLLNRWLTFQVTGHIARQSGKQVVVVASNYLIWILGFSTMLELLGVQYQIARIVSAGAEGVYLYAMMRLWVFSRREQTALVARDETPALEGSDPVSC